MAISNWVFDKFLHNKIVFVDENVWIAATEGDINTNLSSLNVF